MFETRRGITNLLDQHVQILRYFRSEACHVKVTLSVKDQAEAVLKRVTLELNPRQRLQQVQPQQIVPFDFRMRRILLPAMKT